MILSRWALSSAWRWKAARRRACSAGSGVWAAACSSGCSWCSSSICQRRQGAWRVAEEGNCSDISVFSSTQHDLAGVRQAANHLQDGLLFGFHLRYPDRATRLHVFAQQVGGAARHVAQKLLHKLFGSTLERHHQRVAVDLLEQQLDAAVVEIHEVLEQEHLVDDLLGQVFAVCAYRFDGGLFQRGVHQVEDLGCGSYAAHLAALEVLAVEHARQYFGELLQGCGLYPAEGGNTQHHVVTQLVLEQLQYVGGLVTFKVNQNGSDDLRVLVANHFSDHRGFHQIQRIDTAAAALVLENVLDQAGGTLAAQRLGQHRADMFAGVEVERDELIGFVMKVEQYLPHLLVGDLGHGGHLHAQLLDLLGTQVLEHFRCAVLIEGEHQNGAAAHAGHGLGRGRHSLFIQLRMIMAIMRGSSWAISRRSARWSS